MSKSIKWIAAIMAVLVLIVLLAIVIVPRIIDLEKYKPRIEAEAAKALGRPVTLGGKIEPSLFPWIGIALSDVRLGNPPGFKEKEFASVGLFEVRMKLLPLLSGNYEIKTFVIEKPSILLVKKKDGRANWQGIGAQDAEPPAPKPEQAPGEKSGLSIKNLALSQMSVSDGHLVFVDNGTGARHEIKNIELTLKDVTLDQPIHVDFSAIADEHPLNLSGTVGPVGPDPGKSPVDVDLGLELLKHINIQLKGRIDQLEQTPQMALSMNVAPFSLRRVMSDLKQPMPMQTSDESVLQKIALSMNLSGSPEKVALSNGKLTLDDSQMLFSGQAREFDKPNVKLEAALDRIDLDRYLPPPQDKPADAPKTPSPERPAEKKTDYTPLRRLVLDAQIKIGEMKIKNARTRNIVMKASANKGIIRLDPMTVDLYQGHMSLATTINVQKQTPRTETRLAIEKVQSGPLLRDVMEKDIVEGVLESAISLQFNGDTDAQIRRSLNGKGELMFTNGAIVGVDLAGMVRNVQSAFGLAEKKTERPRTDFSALTVPFTVTDGVSKLENALLQSPLVRLQADGSANLVQETLDIRVEPKFVGTLKGQGDTQQRSGVVVPVNVRGTFDQPKFRPDMKAILNQELPDKEALKKMIPPKEDLSKELEKKKQELLKGLPFGNRNQEKQ
ncbi:MAG: hypothetical protein VR64_23000 [Desulfatitalea sp. BRH_c12]|nr:MAG: hypothetical protein VR64_23000 [Desulfatitalea sp. BRH_c12]